MFGLRCIIGIVLFGQFAGTHAGQTCASCSNVEGASACHHLIDCRNDEVCYLHKYSTESGLQLVDLGCTTSQGCPHSAEAILGKRAEGHHLKCTACCNDTSQCNARLDCNTDLHSGIVLPEECSDLTVPDHVTGVYTIYPYRTITKPVSVYCYFDANNVAWTVIQRRVNASANFTRGWESYKHGFGSTDGDFWLGNDVIHEMTYHQNHVVRFDMTLSNGTVMYAEYSSFRIADEFRLYELSIFGYSGTAGDVLIDHTNTAAYLDGMPFGTFDKDISNCATGSGGGWWYNHCSYANLNAKILRWYNGRELNPSQSMIMIRKG